MNTRSHKYTIYLRSTFFCLESRGFVGHVDVHVSKPSSGAVVTCKFDDEHAASYLFVCCSMTPLPRSDWRLDRPTERPSVRSSVSRSLACTSVLGFVGCSRIYLFSRFEPKGIFEFLILSLRWLLLRRPPAPHRHADAAADAAAAVRIVTM